MPRKNSSNNEEAFYAAAEEAAGWNAAGLRGMALLAARDRKDKAALRVYSFVWGRSAAALAKAVRLWPGWFVSNRPDRTEPEIPGSPDELLSLFACAGLRVDLARQVYEEFRAHSWRAWQTRQRVEALREAERRRRKGKRRKYRLHAAAVERRAGREVRVLADSSEAVGLVGLKAGAYNVQLEECEE